MTVSATRTTYAAKIPGLSGGDYVLKVKSASPRLDEARAPYGEITLVANLPESSILSQITPYSTQRVQVDIVHSWRTPVRANQTRSFDFLLHERTIDYEAGTLTIKAVTDEGLLIDRKNVSSTLARTYGLSLKSACDYALGIVGATLEAGAVDATLTSKTLEPVVTTLVKNPRVGTNTTGVASSGGTAARVTSGGPTADCPSYLELTMTSTTSANIYQPDSTNAGLVAGVVYTASVWVQVTAALTVNFDVGTFNVGGTVVGFSTATAVALVANTWTRITNTFTAGAGAVTSALRVLSSGSLASGQKMRVTGMMLVAGSTTPAYFDGASTDPGLYAFAWTGTAHASTSTKTNLPNSDATIWRPGQFLYDWLAPMLQATGRRLFCDERRKWRLVDAGYAIDGQVTVSEGFNAKRGTDTMSRQRIEGGVPLWFDHVAVHYQWTDAAGVRQEAWDFASTGSVKGHLIEVASPWPGPGAAAVALARAAGRGRVQDLVALVDYVATPGMAIVTTLPGTPIQSGVVGSVAWSWGARIDEMSVGSRGLTNTPSDAWVLDSGPWSTAGGTWNVPT